MLSYFKLSWQEKKLFWCIFRTIYFDSPWQCICERASYLQIGTNLGPVQKHHGINMFKRHIRLYILQRTAFWQASFLISSSDLLSSTLCSSLLFFLVHPPFYLFCATLSQLMIYPWRWLSESIVSVSLSTLRLMEVRTVGSGSLPVGVGAKSDKTYCQVPNFKV